ncbi:MAG: hypothetical protein R6X35_03055 [Candidatus Krumholzibacteriia bacterium]
MTDVDLPMHRRASPWRWPAAVGLAVGLLLAGVFLVPRAWLDALFSPLDLERADRRAPPRPWLVLLPPPEIRVAAPDRPDPPDPVPRALAPQPDWWVRGWRIRAAEDLATSLAPTPADSARILLDAVGLPVELAMIARPDSALAARLLLLRREDALRFDALKPYLHAMARSAMHRDLQARVADMYDDFLRQEIIVTE